MRDDQPVVSIRMGGARRAAARLLGPALALLMAVIGCSTPVDSAELAAAQMEERRRSRQTQDATARPYYAQTAASAPAPGARPPQAAPQIGELSGLAYRRGDPAAGADAAIGRAAAPGGSNVLQLSDVLESVEGYFPLLVAAYEERNIAEGKTLKAQGGFDPKFSGTANFEEEGFYQYDWLRTKLEQPTPFYGVTPFAGYKWGRGNIPTWFKDRLTDRGGEFSVGLLVPLLQDGPIDQRRADLSQAAIDRRLAEPKIQKERIKILQKAAETYWKWVAAGEKTAIARTLLEIALKRDAALAERVRLGDLAAIERVDNQRVIVSRRSKLIEAERAFQQAAIELQLFYRDASGAPILRDESALPAGFPEPRRVDRARVSADIDQAMDRRPEIEQLRLVFDRTEVDRQLARNRLLPRIDVVLEQSQDYGQDVETLDKSLGEFAARLQFEAPLLARKAQGELRIVEGRLSQLRRELQFARDRITADVQDAMSALSAAHEQVLAARESNRLARQVESAERRAFELGQSDILKLNLRELATADAAVAEVEALAAYYMAEAGYRAATAADSPGGDPRRTPAQG